MGNVGTAGDFARFPFLVSRPALTSVFRLFTVLKHVNMMRKARIFSLGLCLAASGCITPGPDYVRPKFDTPERWRMDYEAVAGAANTRWWEQFQDPALNQLIESALRGNLDVRVAAAHVEQFAGALTSTRSQFYPQIGYNLDASRNRATERGTMPLPAGTDPQYSLYQGALSADWQLDLFGRVRRQSEAAQAQVFAAEQGRRGVVLTLVASVAAAYIDLRALDRQLEIARTTAANYAETLRIYEARFKQGIVSQVEVSSVQSQYQQAQASIPSIERQIAAQENLVSILLGRNPGPIPRGKTIDQLAAPAIPADLPPSLLARRPDIVQAELNLIAANADIGAARALYYPSFSLTGLLGSVSTALGDFLSGPAATWTLAAGLAGPIFTFGGIEGQVASAEAAERVALASYQSAILAGLRETNDALYGALKKREEHEALTKRVTALSEYARLSRLRFDNGVSSYIEVLYAENELFAASLTAVRAQAERLGQHVAVYKALGGGWVDEADVLAPKPLAIVPENGKRLPITENRK